MPTFHLVRVTDAGDRLEIAPSFESESLIAAGEALSKKKPETLFAVVDENGAFLWQRKSAPKEGAGKDIYE